MKKIAWIILSVIIIILIKNIIPTVNSTFKTMEEKKSLKRIVIIVPNEEEGYWEKVIKAANTAVIDTNYIIDTMSARDDNSDELIREFDKAVASKADAIISFISSKDYYLLRWSFPKLFD